MSKDSRSYNDHKEYIKRAVTIRRQTLKLRAVNLLGGQCQLCGYSRHPGVLDSHHINPLTKKFGISSGGFSRSWAVIESELKKCILVCANCHREIELGLTKLPTRHLQSVNKPLE